MRQKIIAYLGAFVDDDMRVDHGFLPDLDPWSDVDEWTDEGFSPMLAAGSLSSVG